MSLIEMVLKSVERSGKPARLSASFLLPPSSLRLGPDLLAVCLLPSFADCESIGTHSLCMTVGWAGKPVLPTAPLRLLTQPATCCAIRRKLQV